MWAVEVINAPPFWRTLQPSAHFPQLWLYPHTDLQDMTGHTHTGNASLALSVGLTVQLCP